MTHFEQVSEFDFFSEEYRQLFARSSATAFQHPLWLDGIYSRLAPAQGAEPVIVTGRAPEDGTLVFLAPLLRRRYGPVPVVELADLGVADYCTPIFDARFESLLHTDENTQNRLRTVLGRLFLCRLQKIRDDGAARSVFSRWIHWSNAGFNAHHADLYGPFSQWRATALSKKSRRNLGKSRRGLVQKGDTLFEELTEADAIARAFSALRSFRKGRFDDDLLEHDAYFDFYVDMAIRGQPLGLARTYRFTCGGDVIAVDFCLAHRGRTSLLLGGFDFAEYRDYSVGQLNNENMIEDCIARGDEILDFTIGDEPYKQKFGTAPTSMSNGWAGMWPAASLANALFDWRVQLRSLKARFNASDAA